MYCKECGKEIKDKAVICPYCGCKTETGISTNKNKWIALLLWLFLGTLGAHRFYVEDMKGGIAYVVCTCLGWILFGLPYIVMAICLIVDMVNILKGKLKDVELEG